MIRPARFQHRSVNGIVKDSLRASDDEITAYIVLQKNAIGHCIGFLKSTARHVRPDIAEQMRSFSLMLSEINDMGPSDMKARAGKP